MELPQGRIGLSTEDLVIVKTPIPIILISLLYLYIVLKWGPRYMKDRRPYEMKTFIKVYNVFQIVANALIVYNIVDMGLHKLFFFNCIPGSYSDGTLSERSDRLECYILLLKIIDYIETIMFVLRKKQRQISFLHLYHHVSTAVLFWIGMKYFAAGTVFLFALWNCSVHVIMYTYYFLSSFGSSIQKSLRTMKRAVTIIQLVQFLILSLYLLQALMPGCEAWRSMGLTFLTNVFINIALFFNFYRKNYVKQAKQTS